MRSKERKKRGEERKRMGVGKVVRREREWGGR